jgi:hypothetical protein
MKTPMVEAIKAMYGRRMAVGKLDENNERQDHAWPARCTAREVQISMFINYLRETHGEDALGKLAVLALRSSTMRYVIIDGVGREVEVHPLIKHFHASQCLLLRFYREDCSFDGDIRSYINLDNYASTPSMFITTVRRRCSVSMLYTMQKWLKPRSNASSSGKSHIGLRIQCLGDGDTNLEIALVSEAPGSVNRTTYAPGGRW